jgi:hypothetical protein
MQKKANDLSLVVTLTTNRLREVSEESGPD